MLKFNYTKANGTVSERFGLIVHPKSDMPLIMDLTDLTEAERSEVENAWETYKMLQKELWDQFSFSRYVKNFKEENISNREVV